jgi:hypothetical protein
MCPLVFDVVQPLVRGSGVRMEDFSIKVTPESIAEYEKERKAGLQAFSAMAARAGGVKYKWDPPQLNPDGSMSYEDRKKGLDKNAGSKAAWPGTKRVD